MIDNRRPVVNVTPYGEFWRILLPGIYTLKVKNMNFENKTSDENYFRYSTEVMQFTINRL
jgi:hypothetical protein